MKCSSISEHYRGISVSPILSKVLELCLVKLFDKYLYSSRQQFGFKCKSGCSHALYSLHKTVEYCIEKDSCVYLCSMDLVKAFD